MNRRHKVGRLPGKFVILEGDEDSGSLTFPEFSISSLFFVTVLISK